MYINNINIVYYLVVGILGIFAGQFVDWTNIRLLQYKKVFSRDFFKDYLKNQKIKYTYIIIMVIFYLLVLYKYNVTITALKYLFVLPTLMSAFIIDYKEKIIPNRLNLTIFEAGLIFTFIQGIININIAIDMLWGMLAGAGIFIIITLLGGLIAGKEAMGLGDVKFMGALGLFFGWRLIIIISLMAFLIGAIIGIILIATKKKDSGDYIPFGPFIVIASLIATYVPFETLFTIMIKIFTLGTAG